MNSYTLINGDKWRVILRPAVAKNVSAVDEFSREILAMWLGQGKSTGDVIARDDFWSLVSQLLGLLRIDHSEGSPSHAEILEYLQGEPEVAENLFISQGFELDEVRLTEPDEKGIRGFVRDLNRWKASIIIEIHRFEPKKKLVQANAHLASIQEQESQTEQ